MGNPWAPKLPSQWIYWCDTSHDDHMTYSFPVGCTLACKEGKAEAFWMSGGWLGALRLPVGPCLLLGGMYTPPLVTAFSAGGCSDDNSGMEWKHGTLIIQEWNDDRHTYLGMDVWQCIVPTQLCITSLNNDRSVYSMLIETGSHIITTSPVNSLPQFYTHYRESTSYSYAHVCVPVTTGVELFFCHADAAIDFFSSLPSTEREREGNAKLYCLH